jgi:hypothetical protein
MSDSQYQWLLTVRPLLFPLSCTLLTPRIPLQIFYIGYALGQPTMLLWKKIPPHRLVAFLVLCWSVFALCTFLPLPLFRRTELFLSQCNLPLTGKA